MKPRVKRHEALEPLSIEHHYGLLLCWKIREGLSNNIETKRIKHYTDWFKRNYLEPHFEIEEKYIFPILGSHNVRVKKALANHRRLKRLFDETSEVDKSLNRKEEELGRYIRFEEGYPVQRDPVGCKSRETCGNRNASSKCKIF